MALDPDRPMYRWRELTAEQRDELLHFRRVNRLPWHSLPHYEAECACYLITAACYEHRSFLIASDGRIAEFEVELVETIRLRAIALFAWIVLPNHYHVLVQTPSVKGLLADLGRLHGRTSYRWNGEDGQRSRKNWCNAAETAMKSEGHFWASLNYVLHNAVRHGYVDQWQQWPYSNARQYLEQVGRETAERRWRAYPIFDYGATWDPPEL
ncbi:MAG: transposase [Planctomycetota bacterium]